MENETKTDITDGQVQPPEEETTQTYKPQWRPQDADREYIKITTRKRIRETVAHPNAIFKPAKPAPNINDTGHKRVAVYARVSTKSTEQVSSIENQTKYYTEKIAKTPDWEMSGIYKDEGISGTSTKRRKDFKRMIADAQNKKMDLILCASVSRFARDISDCVDHIRLLKTANPSHPVGVYFETEDIYTLDPTSDERLEMHALFSGWESKNKSRRMILSYDQRICMGQYPVVDLLGYRHTENGDLVIEPEEAKTVRFIFLSYLAGYSFKTIAEILTKKKRPTLTGRTEWNASMVKAIMYNERRWGDLDARKTVCIDYKLRKVVKNKDIRDAAYIPNHHEAIVSPSIAKAAHLLASSGSKVNSVPNTSIIADGSLKGFISISPAWKGIDDASLQFVSRGVYSDEEYEELEEIARIGSGEEHSKVLSFNFTGYEVPYGVYFMNQKTPSLTVTYKTIKFNKAMHDRLDCKYIEILYHPILKMIAIKETTEDNPYALCWKNEDGSMKTSLNSKAFSKSIYDRIGWKEDYSFKFRGITRIRGNAKLMIFYLDEPQIIPSKKTIKEHQSADNVASAQYVEYKEPTENAEPQPPRKMLVSETWASQEMFGISLALRKKRDWIVNSISEQDILISGEYVDNPLIGALPSPIEIKNELDNLLSAM